jgi:hypothetical protein
MTNNNGSYVYTRRLLSIVTDFIIYGCLLIPLLIPIALFYRLYIFLKEGYNPVTQLYTFFPNGIYEKDEFSWKGMQMVYEYVWMLPVEVPILIFWIVFVIIGNWIQGYINDFEVKHM